MPARRMAQRKEHKERFRQLIKDKVAREKEGVKARVDEELPSWAAWALKPLVSFAFDRERARDNAKGEAGEDSAFFNLWLLLPRAWTILNDVVLEPEENEFIQLDHILVGPPGIFMVETKAWDGAFIGRKDNWKRKQGNRWIRCASPTRQSLRHLRLFKYWAIQALGADVPANPEEWIHPHVVFTRAEWLKAADCSVPVFQGATSFALHVRRQTNRRILSPELVDTISEALAEAGPFQRVTVLEAASLPKGSAEALPAEAPNGAAAKTGSDLENECSQEDTGRAAVRITEGLTKKGRAFVRVTGSYENALRTRQQYANKGFRPAECKADRFSAGAWYFYIAR